MISKLIIAILLITSINAKYNRKDWKHWSDIDKDCQNSRAEVLIERSKSKVHFKDSKKCVVIKGEWEDYFFNETLSDTRKIDIDHLIPLKHAYENGGEKWSKKEKEDFANDPENLAITNLKYNRQKGAKDITEWLPINKAYACKYIKQWFYLKNKYKLTINQKEIDVMNIIHCDKHN